MGKKNVVVGIRLDSDGKELLDWALVKVADPRDCVVAVHVRRSSDSISKEKSLLEGYLDDYEGLCSHKQVALSAEVLKGNSTRKVLLREAINHNASSLVVGISKHNSLRRWGSIAEYCAKRLPPTTEVMAVYNGRVVFSRCSKFLFEGPCLDPKPSFYINHELKDSQSEFGESEMSEISGFSFDDTSPVMRLRKGSLSSISLPAEDFTKQRPGWPLLQTTSSMTQVASKARDMSVVQWVMTLPNRSMFDVVSVSTSPASYDTDGSFDRESAKITDLKVILMKNSSDCEAFSHDSLNMATANFSSGNLISKGRGNSVYKGLLSEGKHIAIKILELYKEAWKDFTREVDIVTTLKHRRIAPLLGVCVEDDSLMYVYDLMHKGNLAENLHGNLKDSAVLSWEVRFRIAVGIAEALNYLHNECAMPVIHRDVKSSNILLTDELEPQLCDFGLAIWGPKTEPFLMDSDVVGTFGYLAPEYFMYGKVSDKIDVYSFGVVLLELLSGQKPISLETEKSQESLVMWAKPMLESGEFKTLLDPNLVGKVDEVQVKRMVLAAALCLTQAARLRPKISQVLNILTEEGGLDGLQTNSGNCEDYENNNDDDDEVYPDSCVESHLNIILGESTTGSFRSMDRDCRVSVEEYLKERWSRSCSIE